MESRDSASPRGVDEVAPTIQYRASSSLGSELVSQPEHGVTVRPSSFVQDIDSDKHIRIMQTLRDLFVDDCLEKKALCAEVIKLKELLKKSGNEITDWKTRLKSAESRYIEVVDRLKGEVDQAMREKSEAENSLIEHAKELAALQEVQKKTVEELETLKATALALVDTVAPEPESSRRPLLDRLRASASNGVQFLRLSIREAITDALALVRYHFPQVKIETLEEGLPEDCPEEDYERLCAEAKPLAQHLADIVDFDQH